MWQHSVCIAWSFARFCLNRQRSSGSVKGKYTKYRLHIASLRFYAFSNMRSQISSSFLRHGHLPIREVNCYRRLFQVARLVEFFVKSFFQDDCSYVWQVSAAERCEWVRNTEDCYSDSIIQYTVLLFCFFKSEDVYLFISGLVLVLLWLFYLFLVLGTTADNL